MKVKEQLFFEMSMPGAQVEAVYGVRRLVELRDVEGTLLTWHSRSGVIHFRIECTGPNRFQVQHYVAPENVHLLPQEPICMPSGICG